MYPQPLRNPVYVSAEQMAIVDQLMIEVWGIELLQMMENAGKNLARLAYDLFLKKSENINVAVLAGRGGNGGGALVAARHLLNWGLSCSIFLTHPRTSFSQVPAHQLKILDKMNVHIVEAQIPVEGSFSLIIDGLLGYGLSGQPSGWVKSLILWSNQNPAPVLALDLPSGLDATTGKAGVPCVRAKATLTLALPKMGLDGNLGLTGHTYLADIGIPPKLYQHRRLNLSFGPLFRESEILDLSPGKGS